MEPVILRGDPPRAASDGSGYGYGFGDGYGSADGSGDGYGYGYGCGYGYGSGSGEGSGSGQGAGFGYGDGSGYGDGAGSGSGEGSGYSSGDGSGYGDGYGYGYGYGCGSGYGEGSKEYWVATIPYFARKWPEPQQARLGELQTAGVTLAFWRSDANGQPTNNGGRIEAAAPGVVHIAPGPLQVCRNGTLHATVDPSRWKGERWWIVAMHGEVQWDDDKCGALKREILGEAL